MLTRGCGKARVDIQGMAEETGGRFISAENQRKVTALTENNMERDGCREKRQAGLNLKGVKKLTECLGTMYMSKRWRVCDDGVGRKCHVRYRVGFVARPPAAIKDLERGDVSRLQG